MKCPKCHAKIPANQINIVTDLAHCKACNSIIKISEVSNKNDLFDIKNSPKGTWYERVSSNELLLGASTRSPFAFFIVPFMLIWSGGSLGGIYGSQILSGKFDLMISLFGIPFLIGTIIFGSYAIMTVAGKVEIELDKQGGKVFTGVGSIGFTKKFLWSEVSNIRETISFGKQTSSKITLEGSRKLSFGIFLKESRRYYIIQALKNVHYNIKENNTLSF